MTIESDRQAIIQVLTTYARAVDTRNWDLYQTVFAPEAIIDYTSSGGIRASLPEATTWVSGALGLFTRSQHIVTNHDVVVEGDTAVSHADFFNPMGRPDGNGGLALLFVGGAYHDTLRRYEGQWRITSRVEEMLWFTGDWPEDVVLES